ncbi:hypothetical protein [Tahibacter caeni]|uniref:hypothetical protein n=1 Tax=Tahibacter caeni TaxID=1453545 RepID=UPI0021488467|nr:hypothetical protein [Tahibacter caeni]
MTEFVRKRRFRDRFRRVTDYRFGARPGASCANPSHRGTARHGAGIRANPDYRRRIDRKYPPQGGCGSFRHGRCSDGGLVRAGFRCDGRPGAPDATARPVRKASSNDADGRRGRALHGIQGLANVKCIATSGSFLRGSAADIGAAEPTPWPGSRNAGPRIPRNGHPYTVARTHGNEEREPGNWRIVDFSTLSVCPDDRRRRWETAGSRPPDHAATVTSSASKLRSGALQSPQDSWTKL